MIRVFIDDIGKYILAVFVAAAVFASTSWWGTGAALWLIDRLLGGAL